MIDKVSINLPIHQQHIISFFFCIIDVSVLGIFVGSIDIDKLIIFICLVIFDDVFVFLQGEIFAIGIFQKGKIFGFVVEFFLRQHAVFNKYFQIIPFGFELFAIVFENFVEFIGYLFGNVT